MSLALFVAAAALLWAAFHAAAWLDCEDERHDTRSIRTEQRRLHALRRITGRQR